MRTILFGLMFFSVYGIGLSQNQSIYPPAVSWKNCYGGSNNDKGYAIKQTPDGGFIVVGSTLSNDVQLTGNYGSFDIWLVKLTSMGAIEWQRNIGGSSADIGNDVWPTTDGGYIIGATTSSNDHDFTGLIGLSDYALIKTDSAGIIQWTKIYGGTNKEQRISIYPTIDGGYILGGHSSSTDIDVTNNNGSSDIWLVKTDSAGNLQWQKCYGGSQAEFSVGVQQSSNGMYFAGGTTYSNDSDITFNNGGSDFWALRLWNTSGIAWQYSYGGSYDEIMYGLTQNVTLGYVLCGSSLSNDGDVSGHVGPHGSAGTTDAWMCKLTNTGLLQWQDSYGGGGNETGANVSQDSDSGYVFCGWSNSPLPNTAPNKGGYDNYMLKSAKNGNRLWSLSLGGSDNEIANAIEVTADSGYALIGSTFSNDSDVTGNNGLQDIWLVRFGQQIPNAMPNGESTFFTQSFPNPAIEFTQIMIGETLRKRVDEVRIYDVNASLVETIYTAGAHTAIVNKANKKPGIYYYQLIGGDMKIASGKIIFE